jgi:hypothetical protein
MRYAVAMAHIGNLLVLLGVMAFCLPAAFAAGWWARGRHHRPVI